MEYPEVELCFFWKFQRSSKKMENSRGISKKYILNPRPPLVWIFSGIAPYDIPILARLYIPRYQKTWKVPCKLREINVIHYATLSKNQLHKLEKQINNIPSDIKQDHIARIIFQIFWHVILLMSSIYFRVTIMA